MLDIEFGIVSRAYLFIGGLVMRRWFLKWIYYGNKVMSYNKLQPELWINFRRDRVRFALHLNCSGNHDWILKLRGDNFAAGYNVLLTSNTKVSIFPSFQNTMLLINKDFIRSKAGVVRLLNCYTEWKKVP